MAARRFRHKNSILNMKKVWVLKITSESGDDYGCWVYTNKPKKQDVDAACDSTHEEREYLDTEIIESDFIEN